MNMASYGYSSSYPYYYGYAQQPARGGSPPVHLFLLLATLPLLLAAARLYTLLEAAVGNMLHQLRPLLILSPLLLIAAQLWLATSNRRGGDGRGYLLSQMAPGDYHESNAGPNGGSSPWGVVVALVLVLMLVLYQSSFQEWRLFLPRRR